jgi:lipopolysaccharide biosynthesis glycosyltransferase
VNTQHDIVVMIADDIKEKQAIAAHFTAFGPTVKAGFLDSSSIKFEPSGAGARWGGMIKKLEFWNPEMLPEYQKLVYYDADHLVLQNVDALCDCGTKGTLCAGIDRTQNNKAWNKEYFNAGMLVITPAKTDYTALKDFVHAKGFDLEKQKNEWFPKGKPGSLFEQDILNIYFRNNVFFARDGYNSWMKADSQEGHAIYKTQEEWDTHVKPSLMAVHGVLWEDNDWGYKFENWVRKAWVKQFHTAVQQLGKSVDGQLCTEKITACIQCTESDADCLLKCAGGDHSAIDPGLKY